MKPITTVPLTSSNEDNFFKYLNQDKVSHFFTAYDLRYLKEKTQIWVALSSDRIAGYLLEYDKRILQLRGQQQCVIPLLKNANLETPFFNIEPKHLSAVRGLYKPVEPADKATRGLITTFLVMKTTPNLFTPVIRHRVQQLNKRNMRQLGELFGAEPRRTLDLLKGVAFGTFKGSKLVCCAASPDMLEDLAIIRGVQTVPEERGKGYATSACSVLVQKLHQMGKEAFLYVSKDNTAALKVYKRLGFRETGHVFLSFLANRKNPARTGCVRQKV